MTDEVRPAHAKPADLTRLTRQDLMALTSSYRIANAKTQKLGFIAGLSALAFGFSLMTISERAGWPKALDPVFFFLAWALVLVVAFFTWRRERREIAEHQFQCPSCAANILEPIRRPRQTPVSRAELAVNSGICPQCAANLYESTSE